MRTAFAILLLAGLLASPIGCLASCPAFHDGCTHQPASVTLCPYDILSVAKAVLPAVVTSAVEPIAAIFVAIAPPAPQTRTIDDTDLHLANRVLRI